MKIVETICGLLILVGRWLPLALSVIASVVVNILRLPGLGAPGPLRECAGALTAASA